MNYTCNELQNICIKKTLIGGYNEDEVKEIINKIVEDYSKLVNENIILKDRVESLANGIEHYKNVEESLQNTLIIAQQTSEDIKKSAYQKAENIIKDAEMKAQRYVEDANKEVLKIKFEYEQMKKQLHIYKTKSETLLLSQLEVLKNIFEEN